MRRTTSIHNINADKGLNKPQKLFYLFLNWANNLFPNANTDKNLILRNFLCNNLSSLRANSPVTSSPSRKLSDLFWMNLPWDNIKKELGKINIVDVGCGEGNYSEKLKKWSKNRIDHYTGIDIFKNDNWKQLKKRNSNFHFYQSDVNDVMKYIKKDTNFFMSQSAIEHFTDDISYFKKIQEFCLNQKKSIIQVHLIPSASCLYLYLFHGVRQYTPRNISKITKLFSDFSNCVLFNLGGNNCNRLHYKYITASLFKKGKQDLRELKKAEYNKKLFKAIKKDIINFDRHPSFYGLFIHSYWNKKIFK